jgi:hypothetical protein
MRRGPVTQDIPDRGGNYGVGRESNRDWDRGRDRHRPEYWAGYGYGYGVGVPWIYPYGAWDGWYGDPYFDSGYDGASTDPGYYYDMGNYDAQPQPEPEAPYAYRPPYQPEAGSQPDAPLEEHTATLVFKDGRPPMQIRNYLLSRTRLVVLDGVPRTIPVDQLDLAATAKANEELGSDFRLPDGTK